jgi:hypothetical protein
MNLTKSANQWRMRYPYPRAGNHEELSRKAHM